MIRRAWVKFHDWVARHERPVLTREDLIAAGSIVPARTVLPRVRIPDGIAVLRIEEKEQTK